MGDPAAQAARQVVHPVVHTCQFHAHALCRRSSPGAQTGSHRPGCSHRSVAHSPLHPLAGPAMTLTYSSYLKLDQLLALQQPLSQPVEHDEMLFIVIHQVHELWFKLLLHELEKVAADLRAGDLYGSIATFKRGRT